jgi:formylglycine-generating enzyme required for sulfatase activity
MLWLVAAAAPSGGTAAGDPAHYAPRATWQDTMLDAVEALVRSPEQDGFEPFVSGIMRGGEAGQRVAVNLAGAKELYLFVTGIPDVKWAVADWAEARLIGRDGSVTLLTPGQNAHVLLGRCEKDLTLRSGLDLKIRLGDRVFDHGLNVQANSAIRVALDGQYDQFEAWFGVDGWAGTNGQVRFSVLGSRSAALRQLYPLLERDFPGGAARQEMRWEREDRIHDRVWAPGDHAVPARRYAQACFRIPPLAQQASVLADAVRDRAGLEQVRQLYYRSRRLEAALARARAFDWEGLRRAIEDLGSTFPDRYPRQYLARYEELRAALVQTPSSSTLAGLEEFARRMGEFETLQREALLANPLLDFQRLLVLKRKPLGDARRSSWEGYGYGEFLGLPRQSSWNYGTMPNVDQWTNEIAVLAPVRPEGKLATLYKPPGTSLLNDLELHWAADKLLFSMPDRQRNWQIHELRLDTTAPRAPRQLTPSLHPDVHNYSAIYLPAGDIIFLSTAPLQGVPCNAGVIVGMMYKMDKDGRNIRQLTFEQDHDYTPSVLNNGRVLYLRWDYTDTPHIWNRLLMSMNPDGTGQMEYYGANSYWPNAIFFARPIPNHETRIVGIVTGHHEGRVGELFVFDPARGRHETNGVVQRIPRAGPPVEPKIEDKLTEHSWPKFLHPWPLNDKYFLVACKPDPDALWGIYLVDVFDNRVLLKEEEGFALLQPVPLAKRPLPPVIQDRMQRGTKDALVYMEDVYSGPGLRGVPRGTIKSLRLFTYHFGYQKLAGIDHRVGADGPWEAKRVLGTVPVEPDGSAFFTVPSRTPLSFQPLDAEGKAVALMRSWMTAMPGESASCVGCHDRQSGAPSGAGQRLALARPPSAITPWYGPVRGFGFAHEVQPVLDKFCVGCHNGEARAGGPPLPDLRRDQGGFVAYKGGQLDGEFIRGVAKRDLLGKYGGVFEPSYVALRQYVRVGGLESDLHLLPPGEFHADTSELIQMLAKGHHNVRLDREAWDRLVTWIDLNAPCHGTWGETTRIPGNQCQRRLELRQLYGGVAENDEELPEIATDYELPVPVLPEPEAKQTAPGIKLAQWPLPADKAKQLQAEGGPTSRSVDLGSGVRMDFVRIPAGHFVMGDLEGAPDERPQAVVQVDKLFWMARFEVSNEQYAQFDREHESRFEHRSSWIFSEEYLGWRLDRPKQPVVRVSWQEAHGFCRWLSARLGEEVTLPTEAQWEYACRAGTDTPCAYGGLDTDFSPFANLGDVNLRRLAAEGWRPKSPDLIPREARFNDHALVTADIGSYQPNAWGLHDLHGNAAEWTRTSYRPYPYHPDDGRNAITPEGRKVVRGGSWRDRPKLSRSGSRVAYPSWQKVYNVGFRVVIEPGDFKLAAQD